MRSCRRSPAFSLLLVISLFLGWLALSSSVSAFAGELEAIIATEAAVNMSAKDSFAEMFDHALQKELPESEHEEGEETDPGGFNNSVTENQAVLENVARVSSKKNETKEEKSFQFQNFINNENQAEDIPTLIDRKDNVFIVSNPKSKYPVLQLDLSDKLGLSLELGSFAAGVMISTTDLSQHILEQVSSFCRSNPFGTSLLPFFLLALGC